MGKGTYIDETKVNFDVPEIGTNQPVEPVGTGDKNFEEIIRQEAFMNEYVTIEMHIDSSAGKIPLVMPQVNGVNQPIPRGIPLRVKRKYIEVLARNKKEDFQQVAMPLERVQELPDNVNTNQMVGTSMLVDGFRVIEDKNPIGRDWLQKILLEKR